MYGMDVFVEIFLIVDRAMPFAFTLLHESSQNMPLFLISHAHCSLLHKRMFFWKAFHPSIPWANPLLKFHPLRLLSFY